MRLREGYIVLLLLLLVTTGVEGKVKLPKTVIRSWTLPLPAGLPDSTGCIDTTYANFPMRNVQYDHSILNQYNGNLISPLQSGIFAARTSKTNCVLATPYDIYTVTPQDVRFVNTTTPYSYIGYNRGFTTYHEDHDLKFYFTGNLNRRTNLGLMLNYLDAAGQYKNQAGKTFNGAVWGSYNGRNYSLQATFSFNQLSHFDNGGLLRPSDLQNSNLLHGDLPVRMEGMSGLRYLAGYINHYYSVTHMLPDSTYVPLLTFRHVFETNDATRRYIEKSPLQTIYEQTYLSDSRTQDSAGLTTIRNTLSVTFEEAFNRKLRFGASVYAYNECERHFLNGMAPNDVALPSIDTWEAMVLQRPELMQHRWSNNTFVGGAIHKQTGKWIRYNVYGDVCLIGRKLGEFKVDGRIDGGVRLGKDSLRLVAVAGVRSETPDYFYNHFVSNHYCWNNSFDKTYRFHVGGEVAYPTQWFKPAVRVDYTTLTRYIYFAADGKPKQDDGTISVLAGDIEADITTPWVNLDNRVIVQYASSYVVGVPLLSTYHNLYYHGTWFHAMDAQIGVDCHYNTAYYAPRLNPATGQFCAQNEVKVGNYPVLSAYASFYVKLIHLRFFAQYQHLNASFMNRQYFAMPGYPLNPAVIRAGLAFHFYK